MPDQLRYGRIKFNKTNGTFFNIDRDRTLVYDSKFGSIDWKSLSLEDELLNEDKDKTTSYMNLLMTGPADSNAININNFMFHFNELEFREIEAQNDVWQKIVKAQGIRMSSCIFIFISSAIMMYNFIHTGSSMRTAIDDTPIDEVKLNKLYKEPLNRKTKGLNKKERIL